jgi:hypothetical protein
MLAARGEPWEALATTKNLRVAVNQQMVGFDGRRESRRRGRLLPAGDRRLR